MMPTGSLQAGSLQAGSGRAGSWRGSWLAWAPLALVLAVLLVLASTGERAPATMKERVDAIALTLRCQECRGESVATSEGETSKLIRADIAARLEQGQGEESIRAYYVSTYGEGILLNPSSSGVSSLVWILPVAVLVMSISGLVAAFWRWGRRSSLRATDADRALVDAALVDAALADRGERDGG